jgi:hypothetical protein
VGKIDTSPTFSPDPPTCAKTPADKPLCRGKRKRGLTFSPDLLSAGREEAIQSVKLRVFKLLSPSLSTERANKWVRYEKAVGKRGWDCFVTKRLAMISER